MRRHSAFIRGNGSTQLADNIVHKALVNEHEHALLSWYARVPFASDPGDDPSRMRFDHLPSGGASRVSVIQELVASPCVGHTECALGLV